MGLNLEVKRPSHTPKGLQNRGTLTLVCESCQTTLMVIQRTADNGDLAKSGAKPVNSKLRCCCGACGGTSTTETIEGLYHIGTPNDDTVIEPTDSDDDVLLFVSRRK